MIRSQGFVRVVLEFSITFSGQLNFLSCNFSQSALLHKIKSTNQQFMMDQLQNTFQTTWQYIKILHYTSADIKILLTNTAKIEIFSSNFPFSDMKGF